MASPFEVPAGYSVHHFAEIDSTNSEALRLANAGTIDKCWIVADRQSQGRGRRGRAWVSKPGNLYTSLLISPNKSLAEAATLSFVAGIAMHRAILDLAPQATGLIKLKWPNDLLLDGKKITGILVESNTNGREENPVIVVGWGVNCTNFPDVAQYQATSLAHSGFNISAKELFSQLATRFDEYYRVWLKDNGFAEIRAIWLKHAAGIGKQIIVRFADHEKSGIFEALDERGQLILRESNNQKTIVTAGDIFFSGAGGQLHT